MVEVPSLSPVKKTKISIFKGCRCNSTERHHQPKHAFVLLSGTFWTPPNLVITGPPMASVPGTTPFASQKHGYDSCWWDERKKGVDCQKQHLTLSPCGKAVVQQLCPHRPTQWGQIWEPPTKRH